MKYYFRCPKCGNDEQFVKPSEQTSDLGCALLFFGGFIPALIFADHTSRRIQCSRCAHIFRQPAIPSSPLASFAGWILALTVVLFTIAVFFYCSSDLASLLPSIPVISSIEEAITIEPRVAAYLLSLLFILVVIPCWVAACLSNAKYRNQFSTEYHVKPLSSRDIAKQISPQPEVSSESRTV